MSRGVTYICPSIIPSALLSVLCRLAKLAGSKGIAKDWDSDSDESEDIAETGSKGSMNQGRGEPQGSRGQSDAESMQSSQHRRRLHKAGHADAPGSLKRYFTFLTVLTPQVVDLCFDTASG